MNNSICSACRSRGKTVSHPLLEVPICQDCNFHYHNGEFTILDGNEIYCRWCGQGEGYLIMCDTCPKSFCVRCISNNFGTAELERIKNLSDRWCCFICYPPAIRDLCKKNGWVAQIKDYDAILKSSNNVGSINANSSSSRIATTRQGLICYDITRGREKIDIPAINEVDDAPPPLDFVYITEPVVGEGGKLPNNPNFMSCCNCTDNCSDPRKCECILNSGGQSYDYDGKLIQDKPAGIYECNYRCSCNANKCFNRVVGRGPRERLEVFRCHDPRKGWGVRCTTDLAAGTFIADYIGEIVPETESERRGLTLSDEYLFTLDCWGRSNACLKLSSLGLKNSISTIPRHRFQFADTLDNHLLKHYLGEDIVNLLDKRAQFQQTIGKRIREVPSKIYCNAEKRPKQWYHRKLSERSNQWSEAVSIITDRSIIETEESCEMYNIDAR